MSVRRIWSCQSTRMIGSRPGLETWRYLLSYSRPENSRCPRRLRFDGTNSSSASLCSQQRINNDGLNNHCTALYEGFSEGIICLVFISTTREHHLWVQYCLAQFGAPGWRGFIYSQIWPRASLWASYSWTHNWLVACPRDASPGSQPRRPCGPANTPLAWVLERQPRLSRLR